MRLFLKLFPRLATAARLRKVTTNSWKQSERLKKMFFTAQLKCYEAACQGFMVCKMEFVRWDSYYFITEIEQLQELLERCNYRVSRKISSDYSVVKFEVRW